MNSNASSSVNAELSHGYEGTSRRSRTKLEEVYPGLVPSNIEVIIKQAARLEAQLGKVIPPVITEEYASPRLEELKFG